MLYRKCLRHYGAALLLGLLLAAGVSGCGAGDFMGTGDGNHQRPGGGLL